MSGGEIALLVGVCVAFVAAVAAIIVRKLKGRSDCDCGGNCSACGACPHCAEKNAQAFDGSEGNAKKNL